MTKQEILDNPAALSADELAAAVRAGTVSLFELVKTGKLDIYARQALKDALDRPAPEPAPAAEAKPVSKPEPAPVKPAQTDIVDKPAPQAAPTRVYKHEAGASDKKASWKSPAGVPTGAKPKMPKPAKAMPAATTQQATKPAEEAVKPGEVYVPPKPPRKNRPMFRHFFSPKGRITRGELGYTYLIMVVYYVAMAWWAVQLPEYETTAAVCFFCYVYILFVAGIKRCHDLGHCGWWQMIPLYFLWMFFKRGSDETNRYGLTPNKQQS